MIYWQNNVPKSIKLKKSYIFIDSAKKPVRWTWNELCVCVWQVCGVYECVSASLSLSLSSPVSFSQSAKYPTGNYSGDDEVVMNHNWAYNFE